MRIWKRTTLAIISLPTWRQPYPITPQLNAIASVLSKLPELTQMPRLAAMGSFIPLTPLIAISLALIALLCTPFHWLPHRTHTNRPQRFIQLV
jgi:hypothetical protein